MPKKHLSKKPDRQRRQVGKRRTSESQTPSGYASVLTGIKQLIADSRHRALATVNRELVGLYWQIGRTIVEQQETADWGAAVVERLSTDLRLAFPDMQGLLRDNLFRMRQFFLACRDIDVWLQAGTNLAIVGTLCRQLEAPNETARNAATAVPPTSSGKVGTLCRQFASPQLAAAIGGLSWSHHRTILGGAETPAERYFYLTMAIAERWSVRELRRQIDSALFTRYVSVKSHPEKCLPDDPEAGDLLPFKDHYILEFLGLADEYSELELRKAILANLRDFFLEFGKDLTFVGEEYPLTVGGDTFYIDLLFFHRRLQCLIAVDLKIGTFKPEHAGKSKFYCAALDERLRLPHENPSIGLVLCKSADRVQVRLALTDAAGKIGVATYQTALPDEALLRQRLKQYPSLPEDDA